MPRPYVAYLRVYQPLSAFSADFARGLRTVAGDRALGRDGVGSRERELWLRSQLAVPRRLLPGERPDGEPLPNAPQDVLVLDRKEITERAGIPEAPQPPATESADGADGAHGADGSGASGGEPDGAELVCPLDMRPRSAAALVGFLAGAPGPLRAAAVEEPADVVRSRASSVMNQLPAGAVHSVSSTYTVPLPWFALVRQDERHVVLAPRDDPARTVRWTITMETARTRVTRAYSVVNTSIGEDGPARILADTARWLDHFDAESVLELDYGGLVQLLDDDSIDGDTSAQDVQGIIDALEEGDAESVAEKYERLRDFWADLAVQERQN